MKIQGITQNIRGNISFITSCNPSDKNNMDARDSMVSRVELNKMVIHQRQIPDQYWGAGKPSSTIIEEGMKVDTDRNEKERRIKYTVAFLMVEDETTNPEKTEALYESVRSWGME